MLSIVTKYVFETISSFWNIHKKRNETIDKKNSSYLKKFPDVRHHNPAALNKPETRHYVQNDYLSKTVNPITEMTVPSRKDRDSFTWYTYRYYCVKPTVCCRAWLAVVSAVLRENTITFEMFLPTKTALSSFGGLLQFNAEL